MIKVVLNGRIGNQLFQYVVCRSLAERKKVNFCIPRPGDRHIGEFTSGEHLSKYFDIDYGLEDGNIIDVYDELPNGQFSEDIFQIKDYTLLRGYFQSDNYFYDFRSNIKDWLKIRDERGQANEILNFLNVDEYCFIHLRGGDYKKTEHWLLDKSYYDKAIEEMKKIKNDLKFIVISEDIVLASEYFDNLICFNYNFLTDFQIINLAKYCIISNSSFAWWASWLANDQITLAPKNWLNYNKTEAGPFPADIMTERFIWI